MNEKQLYDKIMSNVSKQVKHILNESFEGLYRVTWDIRKRYGSRAKGLKFKKVENKSTTVADYRDALQIFKNIKYKYQSGDHDYYAEVLKIEKQIIDSITNKEIWKTVEDESGTYIGDDVLEARIKKSGKRINEVRSYSNAGEYPNNSDELFRQITNTIIEICKCEDVDDMLDQAMWLKSLITDNLEMIVNSKSTSFGLSFSNSFGKFYRELLRRK